MTTPRFDELIHPPHHLRLCAMLNTAPEVEFAALRDALGVSDPSLSKYLRNLSAAGYVGLTKPARPSGRRRTWAHLTPAGRAAFHSHLAEIARLAEAPLDTTGHAPGRT